MGYELCDSAPATLLDAVGKIVEILQEFVKCFPAQISMGGKRIVEGRSLLSTLQAPQSNLF